MQEASLPGGRVSSPPAAIFGYLLAARGGPYTEPPVPREGADVGDPLKEQAETLAALKQVVDAAGPYLDRLP